LLERPVRYSAGYQVRLDAETYAKLKELACMFDRTRSVVLRFLMQWGLAQTQAWSIDRSIPTMIQPVALLIEPDLLIRDPALAAQYTENWQAHAEHRQPYVGRGVQR
jgi:hypothetical protein